MLPMLRALPSKTEELLVHLTPYDHFASRYHLPSALYIRPIKEGIRPIMKKLTLL
jgi:hypothetical protein